MKAILIALAAACSLPAAERAALVIGNNNYEHATKLDTAVNDAAAMATSLRALGFDVIFVNDATVETLLEGFATLAQRSQGAEAVVVFYAGHGIESGGVNYLVPVDARLEREVQLRTQAVSLGTVLDELKRMNVPARMVLLDCCRNNPLEGRSWLTTRTAGNGLAALAQDHLAEATMVVFSASPGKPALDKVGDNDTHSPFTTALLEQLAKPGMHSFEMFGLVEDAVLRHTEGRQAPRIFYNGSTQPFRNFRFATGKQPPSAPASLPPSLPTNVPLPGSMLPPGTPLLQESGITIEGIYRQFQQLKGKKVLVDVKRLAKHSDKDYFNISTEFPAVEMKEASIEVTIRLLTDLKFSKGFQNHNGRNTHTAERVMTYEIRRSDLGEFFTSSDLTSKTGNMDRKCAWTCLALVKPPQPAAGGKLDEYAKIAVENMRHLKAAAQRLAPYNEEEDIFLFLPPHTTIKADEGSFGAADIVMHDSRIILTSFCIGGGFLASRSEKRILGWVGGITSGGNLGGAEAILKIQ
jgi:hypothetical protein